MKKYILGFIFAIAGIGMFVSYTERRVRTQPRQSGDSKLQVVASFYPLFFFAREIGGDTADVFNVTPAGAEPHEYEPTAADIARIEKSSLLVLNGEGLEAWGPAIEQTIDPKHTRSIHAGEGLTTRQATEEGKSMIDPHVWLSPLLAQKMADAIAQGFARVDPLHASGYASRAAALKERLGELDQKYRRGLASCAEKNIITSHAAFGYLASAYHLNQVSIAGLSPYAEPSPAQLAHIARFAKENGVRFIFFEQLASPKLSETIAREIGAKTLVLNPLEGLSPEEEARGKDYFTEMRGNLDSLKLALQCTT